MLYNDSLSIFVKQPPLTLIVALNTVLVILVVSKSFAFNRHLRMIAVLPTSMVTIWWSWMWLVHRTMQPDLCSFSLFLAHHLLCNILQCICRSRFSVGSTHSVSCCQFPRWRAPTDQHFRSLFCVGITVGLGFAQNPREHDHFDESWGAKWPTSIILMILKHPKASWPGRFSPWISPLRHGLNERMRASTRIPHPTKHAHVRNCVRVLHDKSWWGNQCRATNSDWFRNWVHVADPTKNVWQWCCLNIQYRRACQFEVYLPYLCLAI